MKVKSLSHVRLLVTPWTAAHQALPSMRFSRQEYWSGGAIAFSEIEPIHDQIHPPPRPTLCHPRLTFLLSLTILISFTTHSVT